MVWAANPGVKAVCNFRLLRVSNFREHQTTAVFDLKLMVGGGLHKEVLDESGFRAYCVEVDWGLSFLSVHQACVACAAQCSTAGAALALILRTKLFS